MSIPSAKLEIMLFLAIELDIFLLNMTEKENYVCVVFLSVGKKI